MISFCLRLSGQKSSEAGSKFLEGGGYTYFDHQWLSLYFRHTQKLLKEQISVIRMFDSSAMRPSGFTGNEERKAMNFPETEIQRLKRYTIQKSQVYLHGKRKKKHANSLSRVKATFYRELQCFWGLLGAVAISINTCVSLRVTCLIW